MALVSVSSHSSKLQKLFRDFCNLQPTPFGSNRSDGAYNQEGQEDRRQHQLAPCACNEIRQRYNEMVCLTFTLQLTSLSNLGIQINAQESPIWKGQARYYLCKHTTSPQERARILLHALKDERSPLRRKQRMFINSIYLSVSQMTSVYSCIWPNDQTGSLQGLPNDKVFL